MKRCRFISRRHNVPLNKVPSINIPIIKLPAPIRCGFKAVEYTRTGPALEASPGNRIAQCSYSSSRHVHPSNPDVASQWKGRHAPETRQTYTKTFEHSSSTVSYVLLRHAPWSMSRFPFRKITTPVTYSATHNISTAASRFKTEVDGLKSRIHLA
jgi:hypothetical protein